MDHYLKEELYQLVRDNPRIFEFIQKGSLDGVWYWDLSSEHEWMSPRFWEVLGYDPSTKEHLVSEWQGLIHPDDLPQCLDNLEKHRADPKHPYDQVVRYLRPDGTWTWVRCRGLIIRDDDGNPIRMLGAHTDLTNLKRAEEELRLQAEFQEALLDGLPLSVVVWDCEGAEGPGECRLRYSNTMADDYSHTSLKPFMGQKMDTLWPLLSSTPTGQAIYDAATTQISPPVMDDSYSDDEVEFNWFRMGLHPVGDSRVMASYYNIDAEKNLEKAKLMLRATNSQLEQFAYIASHDLQEPLRTITSFVEILRYDLEDKLTEEDEENLDYICTAATRLRDLVNGLLDFSRVNTHGCDLTPGSLTEVAKKAAKDVVHGWDWVKVEELGTVPMDESQMHRVFMNLISNSVKYAQPGVEPQILVHSIENEHEVIVSVQDNGLGIDPSFHDLVFQPFKRLHTQQAIKGTGIGLAIVKRIIDRHDGTIWVESDGDGKGTTVRFILPKGSSF